MASAQPHMEYRLAEASRVGGRSYNQDRLGSHHTAASLLMVLADGMGGYPHGEVAAQVVVDHLLAQFERCARPGLADPMQFLLRGLGGSHLAILQRSAELGLWQAPRTTAVACVVQDGRAFWSHVGDSRFYLLRKGRVAARSRDHSRVQQLVDAGRLQEDALASHPERNLVLQCLGGDRIPRLEPVSVSALATEDIVLLCSDGLWGPLSARQLSEALPASEAGLSRALGQLARLAETRAGRECDNISALAMLWRGAGCGVAQAPTPPLDEPAAEASAFPRVSTAEIRRIAAAIESASKRHVRDR